MSVIQYQIRDNELPSPTIILVFLTIYTCETIRICCFNPAYLTIRPECFWFSSMMFFIPANRTHFRMPKYILSHSNITHFSNNVVKNYSHKLFSMCMPCQQGLMQPQGEVKQESLLLSGDGHDPQSFDSIAQQQQQCLQKHQIFN